MLIEFRVENHRSIREEQALTLEAGRIGDDADSRPRTVEGHAEPLLPVVVLYGANASGKSNILSALAFMRDAVLESHRIWSPNDGVPRNPFAWGVTAREPSAFETVLLIDGIRYEYGFVVDDLKFIEEWLYAWPNGRKQTWFERDGDSFKFGEHLRGENRVVEQVTRPNALFLSAAVQHRHEQLAPVYEWFSALRVPRSRRGTRTFADLPEVWLQRALDEADGSRQPVLFPDLTAGELTLDNIKDFLRTADVGILDIKIERDPEAESSDPRQRRARPRRILLRHQHSTDEAWLPLREESMGTRAIFELAPSVLNTLHIGGVLVVDELEASLHPLLALHIVRLFNDPASNPKNAQLICATHDTNLLGTTLQEPALRRDQVWFTEKDAEGATRLYPLTDYKPRKAENLERGYLQGRYGAIPFLGDQTWVRGE